MTSDPNHPTVVDKAVGMCLLLACMCIAGCGSGEKTESVAKHQTQTREKGPKSSPKPTRIKFRDVTQRTGIEFVARNGQESGNLSILETLGAGNALLDYDRDGDLDLLAIGGGVYVNKTTPAGRPLGFWSNKGQLQFHNVTDASGLSKPPFYSHGATVGDFDNDGFPDILVTGYGGLQLYRNNGDGTFSDGTAASQLKSTAWNTAAGWGDFNRDGHLDLFLVRYVNWSFQNNPRCYFQRNVRDVCPPGNFQGVGDRLFLSNGDGTFFDSSESLGLVPEGKGLGLVIGDVDRDGDLDAYVGNDATPNFLYLNNGSGKLVESGVASGTAFGENVSADGSMGVDLGDYNNDGRFDLWVANYENQLFALYRNDGNSQFELASSHVGIGRVGRVFVGFGTVFFDADLDGDLDLFATNGHVMRHPRNAPILQAPLLFENVELKSYRRISEQAGEYFKEKHMGRGVTVGDLDGDGDLDLVVSPINQPLTILENVSETSGHSLHVQLTGTKSSRDPIGATVTVRTKSGSQFRQFIGGGSFLSSRSPIQSLGLGDEDEVLEVIVDWPSGRRQRLIDVELGTILRISEPGQP